MLNCKKKYATVTAAYMFICLIRFWNLKSIMMLRVLDLYRRYICSMSAYDPPSWSYYESLLGVLNYRYANQDRLSPEHERTIVQMLLPYHPEVEKKIGCGIDFIMVCIMLLLKVGFFGQNLAFVYTFSLFFVSYASPLHQVLVSWLLWFSHCRLGITQSLRDLDVCL